jgi:hypothetical protein
MLDHLARHYRIYTLLIYVALLVIAVPRHEPWFDEAQAWLLAKDTSLTDLLVRYLRYEGSPGLWHLILSVPAKLNLPYYTVNVVSVAFATAGVWLFLRYAPFPVIVKLLYPFSYFAFFQYAVVARSYCLLPPLLFLLAIVYRTRSERPYLFVLLLGLLANVSTHGLLMAGSIFAVHLLGVLRSWKRLDGQAKVNQLAAAALLALVAGVVVLMLLPPPDLTFARESNFDLKNFFKISAVMLSRSLLVDNYSIPELLASPLLLKAQRAAILFASLVIFIITLWWLRQRQTLLLYLLPLLALSALFAIKWRNVWHEGIPFFLWLFALWISFDKADADARDEASGVGMDVSASTGKRVVVACMSVVLSVHIYWSIYVFRYDLHHDYSGSYAVARYIKANRLEDAKVYATGYKSAAIQPYFDDNIFDNYNGGAKPRFWLWSKQNGVTEKDATEHGAVKDIRLIKELRPDVVIFASAGFQPQKPVTIDGYRFVGSFNGQLWWKTKPYENESYLVFRNSE